MSSMSRLSTSSTIWFLMPWSSVEINLLFSNADSDLDLYLYMVDEDGPFEIAGSWSVTDNEYISETCLPASSYVIEVYNYGMETAGYSLELGCTACGGGPNPCTPFENMTTITQTGLYPGSNDIDCDKRHRHVWSFCFWRAGS